MLAFLRRGARAASLVLVVCNFTPVPRHGYRLGRARGPVAWRERLNTDSAHYGGSNLGNGARRRSPPSRSPRTAAPQSIVLTLPPLATVFVRWTGLSRACRALEPAAVAARRARRRDGGVNFAVFSAHADAIELCLFDAEGRARARAPRRCRRAATTSGTASCPAPGPGLVYGLRAHGPWRPEARPPLQPAQAAARPVCARDRRPLRLARRALRLRSTAATAARSTRATTRAHALKARVADDRCRLATATGRRAAPLADTRALRAARQGLHAAASRRARRRCAAPTPGWRIRRGDRPPAAPRRDRRCRLLPVQQRLDEPRLRGHGPVATTGATTRIGFFCPDPRSRAAPDGPTPARDEFRAMVAALHAAGIEVLLDVVYNHTAEGDELGPTLRLRGLDNAQLLPPAARRPRPLREPQRLRQHARRLRQPRVLQLVLDSLRYWAGEMGVDGFRFDLAPVLGRGDHGFDPQAGVLRRAARRTRCWPRLQADRRALGRRPGRLPARRASPPAGSNGTTASATRMRAVLARARGIAAASSRAASALERPASSTAAARRPPSVNFVAAHDGFTLRDLVSYGATHNHANGEDNRDGHDAQPQQQLRRRRPDRRRRRCSAQRGAAAARAARHPAARAGHADARGRRRARPHAGRQQQRLLPGQRDHLARLGARPTRRCSTYTARCSRCAASSAVLRHDRWLTDAVPRRRPARRRLAAPARRRDDGRRLARRRPRTRLGCC